MMKSTKNLFWAVVFLLPAVVLGECKKCECECDKEGVAKKNILAQNYKIGAITSILAASAVGVCLPVVGKRVPALSPERSFFFIIKAFAAGVILSTGFIHVLPDAFEKLKSPCLDKSPWKDFPFTGFIAMVSAIGTLMVDTYATSYYQRRSTVKTDGEVGGGAKDDEGGAVLVHSHAVHGHSHGAFSLGSDSGETELLRYRVISQVLELGIIIHSVIIGVALGVSENPNKIRPLIAALTFHQFFEGIGLGGCITQARFNTSSIAIMALFFSITTPAGIAIGIVMSRHYHETSPTALIVEGVFNSASAGILIYMALVDLLSADFMSAKMQNNQKLMLGANVSLLFGAGCMSLLAIWA